MYAYVCICTYIHMRVEGPSCYQAPPELHAKLCLFLFLHCSFLAVCSSGDAEALRYTSVFSNAALYKRI